MSKFTSFIKKPVVIKTLIFATLIVVLYFALKPQERVEYTFDEL